MSEAAASLRRGADFAAARGGPLEADYARALAGAGPADAAIARVDPAPDALEDALASLAVLDDLRALRAAAAESICAGLARTASPEGTWRGTTGPASDPVHATGMVAGFLARTPYARPSLLERAGAFLATAWADERGKELSFERLAGYAHFFGNADVDEAEAVLPWCGRELERALRSGRLDAVRAARVFLWCDAHALPGTAIDPRELVPRVLAAQGADGAWDDPADPSAAARLPYTLDAMAVIARL